MLIVLNRVMAFSSQNKIGRDKLGALVEKLVEGMLGVRGWFTEQDWSSSVLHILSTTSNGLSVRFHGQLLEVCGEPVEVLIEAI